MVKRKSFTAVFFRVLARELWFAFDTAWSHVRLELMHQESSENFEFVGEHGGTIYHRPPVKSPYDWHVGPHWNPYLSVNYKSGFYTFSGRPFGWHFTLSLFKIHKN